MCPSKQGEEGNFFHVIFFRFSNVICLVCSPVKHNKKEDFWQEGVIGDGLKRCSLVAFITSLLIKVNSTKNSLTKMILNHT